MCTYNQVCSVHTNIFFDLSYALSPMVSYLVCFLIYVEAVISEINISILGVDCNRDCNKSVSAFHPGFI